MAERNVILRRSALVALLGFLTWRTLDAVSPAADPFARAEEALAARVDEYVELRKRDDWARLYGMTDPRDSWRASSRAPSGLRSATGTT